MVRLRRETSLPQVMQGRWIDADEPSSELMVNGGEITCYGRAVEYE